MLDFAYGGCMNMTPKQGIEPTYLLSRRYGSSAADTGR